MGGNEKLRIFLKANQDVTGSLLSRHQGGEGLEQGLREWVKEKYQGAYEAVITHEPCARADMLLQQLEMGAVPAELAEQGMNDGYVIAQFQSNLWSRKDPADVVVLSLQPEVAQPLWKHRQQGYLFCPTPRWVESWNPSQKKWFQEQFALMGTISPAQAKENLHRLIREIKQRLGAHVIIYNCSSVDPEDHVANYHGLNADPAALRIHKLNLALMQLSIQEGISIIDVDRLVAELGGGQHVVRAMTYSGAALETIGKEFLRVLEDIGFFEKRPLAMQVGRK
jgi:hypothetical protein